MPTLETYNINKMVAKIALFFLFTLTACSYLPSIPFMIDVQQGNVVTEETLEKLKPGMTKSQVLFVLGSPLIVDTFRENRWDYVYLFRKGGYLQEQKRITIYFDDERLVNIENSLQFSKDPVKARTATAEPTSEQKNDDNKKESFIRKLWPF